MVGCFKIPDRYCHSIIIAYLLREKVENWCQKNVRKEFFEGRLRDSELEECYRLLAERFISVGEFCSGRKFQFFIKDKNGVKTFSEGPEIYFDETKKRIHFSAVDFYPMPSELKKRITKVKDILTKVGTTHYRDFRQQEDWGDTNLSLENIELIEEVYDIHAEIWTREYCSKEHRIKYSQLYCGDFFCSRTVYFHLQELTGTTLTPPPEGTAPEWTIGK